MSKLIALFFVLTFSTVALAEQTLHIYVEADEYGEYINYDSAIGADWIKTDDGYLLDKRITLSQLPYLSCIYDSCLTIRKNGYVSFGGFVGDQDAGAEAFFFIPRLADGTFFQAADPYHFNIEGGEYASGLWSTSADIKIVILN